MEKGTKLNGFSKNGYTSSFCLKNTCVLLLLSVPADFICLWKKFKLTLPQCWRCLPSRDFPDTWRGRRARRRRPAWRPGRLDNRCLQREGRDTGATASNSCLNIYDQEHQVQDNRRQKLIYLRAFLLIFQRFPSELLPIEMLSRPSCSHCSPCLGSTRTAWSLHRSSHLVSKYIQWFLQTVKSI